MPVDLTQPLESLPDPLPIEPLARPFETTIRPPGSKSLTNRALLLAALADGESTLRGALVDADDAQVMIAALRKLGARIEIEDQTLRVKGVAGRWRVTPGTTVKLDLHNAGTATRFLTAAAILAPADDSGRGGIEIDGDARMRQRPIGELVDALRSMNVQIDYAGEPGFPPLVIHGLRSAGSVPGTVRFGRTTSSQFISALLLVAPFLPKGLRVTLPLQPTSSPYIGMTIGLMTLCGLERHPGDYCQHEGQDGHTEVSIHPQAFRAFEYAVEPDASGATYFQAAAALLPGSRMLIDGLDLGPGLKMSLQGDAEFIAVLTAMGCEVERTGIGIRVSGPDELNAIDVDLSDMPDTAMTAAVLCCFARPTPDNPTATSTLRGLRTLRVKETDRLAALQTELTKIGAVVEIVRDGDDEALRVTPPSTSAIGSRPSPVLLHTYNDHRMAMALALIGLRVPGVLIQNPACVAKTYPTFWRDLATLYA